MPRPVLSSGSLRASAEAVEEVLEPQVMVRPAVAEGLKPNAKTNDMPFCH
jgi:hypothetical protein